MSANFAPGTEVLAEWQGAVTGGTAPTVYPVATGGAGLAHLEIGPGLVTLFGAPPAAGKTALTMQLVFEALRLTPTLKALVCNVEMGPPSLLDRQLSRLAELPLRLVRKRQLTVEHAEPLARGLKELAALVPRVAFLRPPFDLANVARSADAFGAGLILLDYVQRIGPPGEFKDKRLSLNAVMDAVRGFTDLGAALIVVSAVGRQRDQTGRSSYDSLNLASFRESSELEYGADDAYLILREEDSDEVTLKHVKSRHGEQQDIALRFAGNFQRFDPGSIDGKLSAKVRTLWSNDPEGGDW